MSSKQDQIHPKVNTTKADGNDDEIVTIEDVVDCRIVLVQRFGDVIDLLDDDDDDDDDDGGCDDQDERKESDVHLLQHPEAQGNVQLNKDKSTKCLVEADDGNAGNAQDNADDRDVEESILRRRNLRCSQIKELKMQETYKEHLRQNSKKDWKEELLEPPRTPDYSDGTISSQGWCEKVHQWRQRLDEEYGSNQDSDLTENLTKNGTAAGRADPEISNAEEDMHRNMHVEKDGIELLDGKSEQTSSIQAKDNEMKTVDNCNQELYKELPVQPEPTQCSVPAPVSEAISKKMRKMERKSWKVTKRTRTQFIKNRKRRSDYKEYIRKVPRRKRQSGFEEHPMTPDANDSCISDESWKRQTIEWSRNIPDISNAEEDMHRNVHVEKDGIEFLDGKSEQASSIQAKDNEMKTVDNCNQELYIELPVQPEPTQCSVPAPVSEAISKKMRKRSQFIEKRKSRSDYQEYIRQVPRCERQSGFEGHPMTPDANDTGISVKSWNTQSSDWTWIIHKNYGLIPPADAGIDTVQQNSIPPSLAKAAVKRSNQILHVKSSKAYKQYAVQVPKNERQVDLPQHPVTPVPNEATIETISAWSQTIKENYGGKHEVTKYKQTESSLLSVMASGAQDCSLDKVSTLLELRSSPGSSNNVTNTSCSNSSAEKGKNIKKDSELGARHPSDCDEIGHATNNGLNCFGDSDANPNTESINSSHHRRRDTHSSFKPFSTGVIEILDDSDSDVPIDEGKGSDFRKAESKSFETPVAPIIKKSSKSNTHPGVDVYLLDKHLGESKLSSDVSKTVRKDAEISKVGGVIEILDDDEHDDANNDEILMSCGEEELECITIEESKRKSIDSIIKSDNDEDIIINDDDDNSYDDRNFWQDDDRPCDDDDDIEIIETPIDEEEVRIRQELERKMRAAAEKREKDVLKIQEDHKKHHEELLKIEEEATKKREEMLLKAHRKRKEELLNSHKKILKERQKERKERAKFSGWTFYKAKSQKSAPDLSSDSKAKKRKFQYNYHYTCEDEALREQERLLQQSAARVKFLGERQRLSRIAGGMQHYKEVVSDVSKLPSDHYKWSCMYSRLGVPKKSGDDVVKKNYRRLCLLYHPDKAKCDDAPAKFQAIKEAYESLVKGFNCN